MCALLPACCHTQHTQQSPESLLMRRSAMISNIRARESIGAGVPQRLRHGPGQSCHHLVSAHASALQQCMPLIVVSAQGAILCDATLGISFLLLHCSSVVPPWRAKLKQGKLKGQTLQLQHTGILLVCDTGLHTETLNCSCHSCWMLQFWVNTCKVTVHGTMSDCTTNVEPLPDANAS